MLDWVTTLPSSSQSDEHGPCGISYVGRWVPVLKLDQVSIPIWRQFVLLPWDRGIEEQRVSMPGHKVDFRIMDEKQSIEEVRPEYALLCLAGPWAAVCERPCQSPSWFSDLVSLWWSENLSHVFIYSPFPPAPPRPLRKRSAYLRKGLCSQDWLSTWFNPVLPRLDRVSANFVKTGFQAASTAMSWRQPCQSALSDTWGWVGEWSLMWRFMEGYRKVEDWRAGVR